MERKTVAIIQARMSSTRLPGKVLLDLNGKSVLEQVVNRIRQCRQIDEVVIATTEDDCDQVIVEEAKKINVSYYTGDTQDVLNRYFNTAVKYHADIIVRITSDCPLIDPLLTDDIVKFYKEHEYDFVANVLNTDITQRTYPRGLDTEVFSFELLKEANLKASEKRHREHVTMYMYENVKNIYCYKNDINYSKYRWTLDTKEDLELIDLLYKNLDGKEKLFSWMDVVRFVEKNPEICKINEHIEQKEIK
jgi:spore coat polysaccharide biosynthesis protein SpsF